MGVDFKTTMRNFSIDEETFAPDSHDVQDGIVTPGSHKVMRFDSVMHNAGNADAVLGSPQDGPDLFVFSKGHDHYHLKDFIDFKLLDQTGQQTAVGAKAASCLTDDQPWSPGADPEPHFTDCNVKQGISAGWADIYDNSLPGQYVVMDGVPDGDYTLGARINPNHVIAEDSYADNTEAVGLHIQGDTVEVTHPSDAALAALDHLWV